MEGLQKRWSTILNTPTDTSGLILEFFLGHVLVYPPIGTTAFTRYDSTGNFVSSIKYSVILRNVTEESPASFAYVALAWRYGLNFGVDWRPAGVYTTHPNTFIPSPLVVPLHRFPKDINIECDFRNPPPRPWQ